MFWRRVRVRWRWQVGMQCLIVLQRARVRRRRVLRGDRSGVRNDDAVLQRARMHGRRLLRAHGSGLRQWIPVLLGGLFGRNLQLIDSDWFTIHDGSLPGPARVALALLFIAVS